MRRLDRRLLHEAGMTPAKSAALIQLAPLPFAKDALSPHISAETLKYHYVMDPRRRSKP